MKSINDMKGMRQIAAIATLTGAQFLAEPSNAQNKDSAASLQQITFAAPTNAITILKPILTNKLTQIDFLNHYAQQRRALHSFENIVLGVAMWVAERDRNVAPLQTNSLPVLRNLAAVVSGFGRTASSSAPEFAAGDTIAGMQALFQSLQPFLSTNEVSRLQHVVELKHGQVVNDFDPTKVGGIESRNAFTGICKSADLATAGVSLCEQASELLKLTEQQKEGSPPSKDLVTFLIDLRQYAAKLNRNLNSTMTFVVAAVRPTIYESSAEK